MSDLLYILNVVAPIFLLVLLGLFLRQKKLVTESFVDSTSKFVFRISLPALIFLKLYDIDLSAKFDIGFFLFIVIATVITFFLSWGSSFYLCRIREDRGVFIQGAFRGNYAIIGLAVIAGMFGNDALAKASLVLPFVLPIYNIFSVIVLTIYGNNKSDLNFASVTKDILLNPLILAVVIALPFAFWKIPLLPALIKTGEYISVIALPLALIGIGGSMNLRAIKKASRVSLLASTMKIIIIPVLATWAAFMFGYSGSDLGILFVIFACPTAIASFVMAIAMGSSGKIAGNIIVISTLASLATFTVGLYLLRLFNLI